jgi:hypothetical protein
MMFARKDNTAPRRLPCEVQTNREEARIAKDSTQTAPADFPYIISHISSVISENMPFNAHQFR